MPLNNKFTKYKLVITWEIKFLLEIVSVRSLLFVKRTDFIFVAIPLFYRELIHDQHTGTWKTTTFNSRMFCGIVLRMHVMTDLWDFLIPSKHVILSTTKWGKQTRRTLKYSHELPLCHCHIQELLAI